MKTEQIIANNKLIAEFMGFKKLTNGTMKSTKAYGDHTIGEDENGDNVITK